MYAKASKFFTVVILSAGLLSLFLPQPIAQACTGIMLRNSDGTFVHGRTLEFGMVVETMIAIVPRGYEFVGKAPGGPGMKYKSKYACHRARSRLMT